MSDDARNDEQQQQQIRTESEVERPFKEASDAHSNYTQHLDDMRQLLGEKDARFIDTLLMRHLVQMSKERSRREVKLREYEADRATHPWR